MTSQPPKVGQALADQRILFAQMLQGIARLGEVQKIIALALVEAHIEPATKVVISSNLAAAINGLNRASHMIMHASVKAENGDDTHGRDHARQPH
jgi:hypothetical protein